MDERLIQRSPIAKQAAIARFQLWGARNLVKVTNLGPVEAEIGGYIGFMQAIADKDPSEISLTLGLRAHDLVHGAMIYRLERLPRDDEFEVRGYSTLPDGRQLEAGRRTDSAGFRVGTGAPQYVLLRPVPARLLGRLRPGERFDLRSLRP